MNNETYLPVKDLSIYPEKMLEAIESIPDELLEKSESGLQKKINPTLKLYELKQNFWTELHSASNSGRTIKSINIYRNVCSKEYFYRAVLKSPDKMAWIVHPLTTYENRISAALQMATERYEELISMDITTLKRRKDEDGEWIEFREIDAKKAGVLLAAIKQLEDRKLGVAVQRQINVNKTEDTVKKEVIDDGKLDDRIREIEEKLGSMNEEIIDV